MTTVGPASEAPRTSPTSGPSVPPARIGSPLGRAARGLAAVVLLATMGAAALPDGSPVERLLVDAVRPVLDVTGIEQPWAMFAPVPRGVTLRLRAEVVHADGTVTEWEPPTGGRGLGAYRGYRWRKWMENAVVPDRAGLHEGAVHHLVALAEAQGRAPVVAVRLWRGVATAPPPGSGLPLDRDPVFDEVLLLERVLDAEPSR